MLKKSLELQALILNCNKLKKKYKNIWDVILYGSFIRGDHNTNDIDLAILLKEETRLNKKLELAQLLKYQLSKLVKRHIDVKVVDFSDFLDSKFLARQGIIGEGYSLIDKQFLHEKFGFKTFTIFTYFMDRLTVSQKKMLYYALKGRRGQIGILKEKGMEELKPGVIKVPIHLESEFEEMLNQHRIRYKIQTALFYSFL